MKNMTKDKAFYKNLLTLAIPIVLQNFITFAVNFADNIMIGKLGDIAVSGVYMGNQFQTVLQMFIFGIDAALLIIAAQYWGIRDTKSVKKIGAMGIRASVYVGALFTLLVLLFPHFFLHFLTEDESVIQSAIDYVKFVAWSYVPLCASQLMISSQRSVENAKLGFWTSFIALFANIFLNWIFIFGKLGAPEMGVAGAGLATLIARIVECFIVYIYAFFIDRKLAFTPKDLLGTEPTLLKDFVRNGTPVVMGQLVWAVNMIAYSAIMGHLSPAAVTASSLVAQLENFLRVGVFGLSAALGIITSKTVGAGLYEKEKEYAKTAEVIFLVIGLFSALLITLLKNPFLKFYNVSDDAINICHQFFNVLTFTYIGTCWQATTLSGLVKSGGDTSFVFKNDSIFVFLVLIPGGLIALKTGAPAWVVFLALKADQVLKCIVAYFKVNSFNWMKKLTREDLNAGKASE